LRDNIEVYKIWAPDDSLWSPWAKPVLFMQSAEIIFKKIELPEINWMPGLEKETMIVVDLPDRIGVHESLALARLGYRPVPLYNGVDGRTYKTAVKVDKIATALFEGTYILEESHIKPDAPPVFMLDSNRMKGKAKVPGSYDNRWCVFPQDMPSAAFLKKAGICKVIVRSDKIENDLSHILLRYQQEGIEIYLCNGEKIKKVSVVKPSKFRSLSYRFKVILGLTRNSAGGFGGRIPEPTQSSSRGRYYGYG